MWLGSILGLRPVPPVAFVMQYQRDSSGCNRIPVWRLAGMWQPYLAEKPAEKISQWLLQWRQTLQPGRNVLSAMALVAIASKPLASCGHQCQPDTVANGEEICIYCDWLILKKLSEAFLLYCADDYCVKPLDYCQ